MAWRSEYQSGPSWIVAILALAVVLVGPLIIPVRTHGAPSRRTINLRNVKQLATAVILYSCDHDDRFPPQMDSGVMALVLQPFYKDKQIFTSTNPRDSHYVFFEPLAAVKQQSLNHPDNVPLVFDRTAWQDQKRHVAFADSHAKSIEELAFPKLCFDAAAEFKSAAK